MVTLILILGRVGPSNDPHVVIGVHDRSGLISWIGHAWNINPSGKYKKLEVNLRHVAKPN
jgi:hypothetical protein